MHTHTCMCARTHARTHTHTLTLNSDSSVGPVLSHLIAGNTLIHSTIILLHIIQSESGGGITGLYSQIRPLSAIVCP